MLLLDEQFGGVTGVQCPDCGWLGLEGESCPADGRELVAARRPDRGDDRARRAAGGRAAAVRHDATRSRLTAGSRRCSGSERSGPGTGAWDPIFERTAMLRKLLFGAAAAGAIAWLAKNQEHREGLRRPLRRRRLKGAAGNVAPGVGREPAEERLERPRAGAARSRARSSATTRSRRSKVLGERRGRRGLPARRGAGPGDYRWSSRQRRASVDGVRAVENLMHLPTSLRPPRTRSVPAPA